MNITFTKNYECITNLFPPDDQKRFEHFKETDVKVHLAVAVVTESYKDDCVKQSSDNFFEMHDAPVANDLNNRCFFFPPVLDHYEVEWDGCDDSMVRVSYTVVQQYIYCSNAASFDDACFYAIIAANRDDALPIKLIQTSRMQWEMSAPDLPPALLAEGYAASPNANAPSSVAKKEA